VTAREPRGLTRVFQRSTLADSVVMVLAGALLAGQARVNGSLDRHLGATSADAVLAAFVSFSVGTVVVIAIMAATANARAVLRAWPRHDVRWWYCTGGLGGATLVSVSAAAVPLVGVALLSVCTVAGQTSGSLAVDEIGLASGGRRPLSVNRVVGSALAIGALAIGAIGHRTHGRSSLVGLYIAITAAGFLVAGQQAVNGRLRDATGQASIAATISFLGGTAVLGLGTLGFAVAGKYGDVSWPSQWWCYLGGIGGALYITLGAATVSRLGVLGLTLSSIAGQLLGSVILDLTVPAHGEDLTVATTVGVVLTFIAAAIAARPAKRHSS
jgi:bacterial/archaeal transporter family-2 protein